MVRRSCVAICRLNDSANGSCLSENFYYQGSGKALPARLYGEFTEAIPPAKMVQEAHQCGSLLQSRRDSMELCTLMGLKRYELSSKFTLLVESRFVAQ